MANKMDKRTDENDKHRIAQIAYLRIIKLRMLCIFFYCEDVHLIKINDNNSSRNIVIFKTVNLI